MFTKVAIIAIYIVHRPARERELSSSIKWLSLLVTKCTVFDDVISPTS